MPGYIFVEFFFPCFISKEDSKMIVSFKSAEDLNRYWDLNKKLTM